MFKGLLAFWVCRFVFEFGVQVLSDNDEGLHRGCDTYGG